MRAPGSGFERITRLRVSTEKFSAGHCGVAIHFYGTVEQVPDAIEPWRKRCMRVICAHADPKNERALIGHLIPAR